MAKKQGLIGLYSGRQIRINAPKKGHKLTRTQTAKQAFNFITKKYGKVVDNAKYFHVGKGEWRKYSLKNDSQFTGKMTDDKNEWTRQPHKLDYRGIDDKYGKAGRGEYFGKDLSKGKYSPKINTKRNVISILKKKYPKTQFIVAAEWGFNNIGVFWAGGPSVSTLKRLDMSRGLKGKRDWIIGIDIDFKKESPKEFKESLQRMLRDKDSRTFYKASATLPIKTVVKKASTPKKQAGNKVAISQIKQAKPMGRNARKQKLEGKPILKSIPKKWNFQDQTHPEAMYIYGNTIKNGEKYSKAERIKYLNMEISRVKSWLKGERAYDVKGLYNVPAANRNAQSIKMTKINKLLEEKKKLEKMLRLEKGLPQTPKRTSKPHVQYFNVRNGESSNRNRNSNYRKVTSEMYPMYHTFENGSMIYTGWVFQGTKHYIDGGVVEPVKSPCKIYK